MTASGSRQSAGVTAPATSTSTAALSSGGGKATRYIFNDSAGKLYVLLGTGTASATNFSFLIPTQTGQVVEGFGGAMQGVLDTGTGFARISEW
jgi:hypothetical protein